MTIIRDKKDETHEHENKWLKVKVQLFCINETVCIIGKLELGVWIKWEFGVCARHTAPKE